MIVKHRRGTTEDWRKNNIIPEAGELVIEECNDGTRRAKFGTGYQYFSDLPYIDDKLWEEIASAKTDLNTKIADLNRRFSKEINEAKDSFEDRLTLEARVRTGAIADLNTATCNSVEQLRNDFQKADGVLQEQLNNTSAELYSIINNVGSSATAGIGNVSGQIANIESTINRELISHRALFDKKLDEVADALVEDYTIKITDLTEGLQATSTGLAEVVAQTDENKAVIADFARAAINKVDSVKESLKTQIAAQAKRIDNLIAPSDGEPVTNEVIIREFEDLHIGYDGELHETAGGAVRDIGYKLDELEESLISRTVNGLHYEDNQLYLTSDGKFVGNPVTITGGSGGGSSTGGSYSVRLYSDKMKTNLTVAAAEEIYLWARFTETFDRVPTQAIGTLTVLHRPYNKNAPNAPYSPYTLTQEESSVVPDTDFKINVAPILNLYDIDTKVEINFHIVAGESKIERDLLFTVTQREAFIKAIRYDEAATYDSDLRLWFTCIGKDLEKEVIIEIDGVEHTRKNIGTSHNKDDYIDVPLKGKISHGAHIMTLYYIADGVPSTKEEHILLFNDKISTDVLLGTLCDKSAITNGEALTGSFVVDTPGANQDVTTEVRIQAWAFDEFGDQKSYEEQIHPNVQDNKMFPWAINNYPASGELYITFISGATEKLIKVQIEKANTDYETSPVTTGLIYAYNAKGYTNSLEGKELYKYDFKTVGGLKTTIEAVSEDFNWVSNGYVDGEALTLSGAAKHTIKLPMFSTSYIDGNGETIILGDTADEALTKNGRTFEIDFSVSNITDIKAPIIECISKTHAGFVVTPQIAYLLSSNGKDIQQDNTGFIENETEIAATYIKDNSRIRLAFVIEPLGFVKDTDEVPLGQCLNIYIDGQFAKSVPYSNNANFVHDGFISIGSDTCITKVYEVRVYNRGLSTKEILQNYKAAPARLMDKEARFKDNDILNDFDEVDYYKAINKYPCLLITGPLAPYKDAYGNKYEIVDSVKVFQTKTDSGVTLTKPDGNGSYTTHFDLLDKNEDGVWVCSNNVQGTSSVKFPVKNYKVYLAEVLYNEDGTPKTEEDEFGKARVKTKKVKYSLKGQDAEGNDLSIGESTLCWKGDYMSSDHANTFNANMANDLFGDVLDSQNPAKGGDPRVQNTIYGFRCLLFQRDDIDGSIKFIGDGALNNDKGNTKTFGLEHKDDKGNDTLRQKWEFKNNTNPLCMFETDRFFKTVTVTDDDGTTYEQLQVLGGLESTYPDQGDLEKEGLTPKYDQLQTLYTWVYQRANFWDASDELLVEPKIYNGQEYFSEKAYRKAIFINEFEKHFNKNHTLVYYLFSEFTALCDNRAKNMFLRSEDIRCEKLLNINGEEMSIMDAIDFTTGEVNANMIDWENSIFAKWITDLYDLDSCFGVENSGYLQIPYYAEWNYTLKGKPKFNGLSSRLWLMFEDAFAADIKKKAQALTARSSGGLNYDTMYDYHIKNNALNVCAAVVNQDMKSKYSDPWEFGYINYAIDGHPWQSTSEYKYLQRGSRTTQKDAFIHKRSNMLYSKYLCDKFLNNNINFRCGVGGFDDEGNPYGGLPIEESGITIAANQSLYPAVKFGDGESGVIVPGKKIAVDETETISKPGAKGDVVGYSDTIYIAGGSLLTDIGDISKYHPYEIQLQNATSLKQLTLGSAEIGFENTTLQKLEKLDSCPLLEELNIMGCTALESVDLSKNMLLKTLYSSAQSVKLPNGGVLEKLHLGNVVDLEVLNQTKLIEFKYSSLEAMSRLWIENTPKIPALALAAEYLPKLENGLRLVGVNEQITKEQLLKLTEDSALNKYLDADGNRVGGATRYPYISGTCIVTDILTGKEYTLVKSKYPNLNIEYAEMHTDVTFKYQDSTGVGQEKVISLVLKDSDVGDLTGHVELPEAYWPTDDAFTYTFKGWSEKQQPNKGIENTENDWNDYIQEDALENLVGSRVLYPVFEAVRRIYDVTFINPTAPFDNQIVCVIPTPYGSAVDFTGVNYPTPKKLDTDSPDSYEFTGWSSPDGTLDEIVSAITFEAQFAVLDSAWYHIGVEDISDCVDRYGNKFNGYELDSSNNTMSITECKNDLNSAVKIPESFSFSSVDYEVTKLGGFQDHFNLELVSLPNTLQILLNSAFAGCSNLTEIILPDSLLNIGQSALQNCTKLKTITIPANAQTIENKALAGCYSLKSINVAEGNKNFAVVQDCLIDIANKQLIQGLASSVIPADGSVTSLAPYCFDHMQITTVDIPSGITVIPDNAFSWCTALTAATLPNGLTHLNHSCFAWCYGLTDVVLPESLTEIQTYVFNSCALREVTIPAKVDAILNQSFGGISSLQTVTFKKALNPDDSIKIPEIGATAFADSASDTNGTPTVFNVPWSANQHYKFFVEEKKTDPTFGAIGVYFVKNEDGSYSTNINFDYEEAN